MSSHLKLNTILWRTELNGNPVFVLNFPCMSNMRAEIKKPARQKSIRLAWK